VLPCRDEDILKIGFSRDPVRRLQTLHQRFFEFFDLDRALLIETDRVRDARIIERTFLQAFSFHQAPAPLIVPDAAGGRTEWFRGLYPAAVDMARNLSADAGFNLRDPLSTWLRDQLSDSASLLFSWSSRMLEAIEFEQFNVPIDGRTHRYERALRNVLDAYSAIRIDLDRLVPEDVLRWHAMDHSSHS
jgi:hypothetical protein